MKLKTFATMLLAAFGLFSSAVFADVLYQDSTDGQSYAQVGNAEVVVGASARANNILITYNDGTTPDITVDTEIILRLPDGLNFASTPEYTVTPSTTALGLTLKDAAGDPATTKPLVVLSDTNGDGGDDRAVVTVATAAALSTTGYAGDTLTIAVTVTADDDAAVSTALKPVYKATLIQKGKPGVEVDLVKVIKTAPTLSAADTALVTKSSGVDYRATPFGVLTPTINLTIPAGAKNGQTITLSVNGAVLWDGGTTTVTVKSVKAPVKTIPLTGTIIVNSSGGATSTVDTALTGNQNGGTSTITMIVQGATPVTGYKIPVPVTIQLNSIELGTATVGVQGVTVAGTAGISGKANLVNVKAAGSSAALASLEKATKIVKGADKYQVLPKILLTENFEGDLNRGTTKTITITAGKGLSFFKGSSTGISVSGLTNEGGTYTTTVYTFDIPNTNAAQLTATISGIRAVATAEGTLTVTVGGTINDSKSGVAGVVIDVATGVAVGTVDIAGPKKLANVGSASKGKTTAITLKETTYGAITMANKTETTNAYISIVGNNAKITGATIAASGYGSNTAPTFAAASCKAESTGSATFICGITAESDGIVEGTSTVTITPTWTSTGAVGDVVSFTLGGNAGVSGSADAANIQVASEIKVGEVPQLTLGSTEAQSIAAITLNEKFVGSLSEGDIRLQAPAGVKFSATGFTTTGAQTSTTTVSTFETNDTLVIPHIGTATITFTPKVFVSSDAEAGDMTFSVLDGDINGKRKSGVVAESIVAGYAVAEKSEALSGGADLSIGVGFSITNEITGGIGTKTATSSDTGTVTVSVDGDTVTVTGIAAGAATVTVKDSLGATDAVAVTISAAEQAVAKAGKALDGSDLPEGTNFTAGASADGGVTQATEFTTADTVEIVATVEVGTDIQGEAGAIHVALMTKSGSDTSFAFLNEDGNYETWDISGLPGVHIDAEELAASYSISLYSGELAAGTYRFALAYSSGGNVYYTGKAITLTVTE